jgi:hypothetical protein
MLNAGRHFVKILAASESIPIQSRRFFESKRNDSGSIAFVLKWGTSN